MAQESWDGEQEETGCQQPAGPVLCANNCGFFGSAATMNLCSKCYREIVLKKADAAVGERSMVSLFGDKGLFVANQEEVSICEAEEKTDAKDITVGERSAASLVGDNNFFSGKLDASSTFLAGKEDEAPDPCAFFRKQEVKRSIISGGSSSVTLEQGVTSVVDSTPQQNQRNGKAPNRCLSCRKRVGLMGFKCRCGDIFCALHRYSDKHNCTFDYKTVAREAIAKANPVIKANKIERI